MKISTDAALWGTRRPGDPLFDDFRVFLWLIWKAIGLPEPTAAQYDIARWLQHGPNFIAIEAFRGIGKSFITSAYVLWLLYRDPQHKVMVVSASKNRADNFVMFTLQLIQTVPELAWLLPREGQRQSRVEFDVGPSTPDQTPSVFARGIDSQLTGGRADTIVSDDVEVPNNSMTADMREKLQEKTKEYAAILKPKKTSKIIYLGTPQTEDSIYNKLPENFTKRIWPAQVPTPELRAFYGDDLSPMVAKMYDEGRYAEPVDPKRFNADELAQRRAMYGAAGYQLQFMLNTALSDEERFPIKLKNLVVTEVPPEKAPVEVMWLPNPDRMLKDLPTYGMAGDRYYRMAGHGNMWEPYQLRAMSVDPSGKGKDETGYAVGFMLAGNIWVPEAGGLEGGYELPVLEKLALKAKKHKVNQIIIEENFGGGMFGKLLSPVLLKHGVQAEIVDVRHSVMKEQRILDTLEPVVGAHRLIIDPSVITEDDKSLMDYEATIRFHKSLFHQMTHICREKDALKFDDRVDALAMLVAHFAELMDQDQKKTEAIRYKEWLEEQTKGWHLTPLNRNAHAKKAKWATA